MRKTLHLLLLITLLVFAGGGGVKAQETKTFSFAETSKTAGTLTDAPTGVTATFKNTGSNANDQLTANNSMTLTITGLAKGTTITGVNLNVHNNSNKGKGSATITLGNTTLGTLTITGLGATYVSKDVTPFTAGTVDSGQNLVITIKATANSVYCNKFTISYQEPASGKTKTTLTFTDPADKTFDLNATEGTEFTNAATLTPSVEGATITYSSNNENIAVVDEKGEVLVTTEKEGTATITASYAGDATYDAATTSYNITVKDPNQPQWIKTNLTDLTSTDQFVIVDLTSKTAMSNDKGTTDAPIATAVTLNDDKTEITSEVADNLKWNLSVTNGNYTFYPNGSTSTWLYVSGSSSNNNLRVGTGDNKTFTYYASGNYSGLKGNDGSTDRYIHSYSNQDWRTYKNSTQTSTSIAYFKRYASGEKVKTSTTLKFADGDKAFYQGDTEGLTFSNAATLSPTVEGATITYTSSNEDIASVDNNGQVTVKTENEGTATITASFEGNNDYAPSTESYKISVEQVYQNIAALKAAYSKSNVTGALRLKNAKVTYIDGNNKYLEDESGAVCVYNVKSFSYVAGDVLNGIANVTLTNYKGLPEINAFTAIGDITKTSGEAPVPTEITVADANEDANLCKYVVLKKVTITPGNSGNATASDNNNNSIAVYEKGMTFVAGEYDLIGIVSAYNNKQIAFISYAPDFDLDENAANNSITPGENATVKISRTFNTNAWNTLVLPFDMTAEQISSVFGADTKVANYTGTAESNGAYTLNFETATSIEANKPVFIYGAKDAVETISGITVVSADATNAPTGAAFSFVGTYTNGKVAAGDWFIAKDNKFYRSGDGQNNIKPLRATFHPTSTASAAKGLFMSIDGATPTAISQITTDGIETETNAPAYNLSGQRVSKNYKGIVVRNGRKYINK